MHLVRLLLILTATIFAGGCELIVDIFQAGLVVGIILVLIVIAMVMWIARKFRRR